MPPIIQFALGVVLSAGCYFIWSAISWMALPWQRGAFRAFRDEDAAADALRAACAGSGVYGFPAEPKFPAGADKKTKEAIELASWEKVQRGPLVFAVVSYDGFGTFPRMLLIAFLGNLATAALFGAMLAQTSGLGFLERTSFVVAGAMAGAVACRVPDWNWHKFPLRYTVIQCATLAVGTLLSGLVLAWFVTGRP